MPIIDRIFPKHGEIRLFCIKNITQLFEFDLLKSVNFPLPKSSRTKTRHSTTFLIILIDFSRIAVV